MKTATTHPPGSPKPHRRGRWQVAVALLGTLQLFATEVAFAQAPVFGPGVNLDQKEIMGGHVPLEKLLESGGQFWTTPFTVADGMGEGATGPRAAQRAALYPNNPTFPFLRLNGIDSQSCYECHNSIGSYVVPGGAGTALIRKPGSVGGSAGFNSDAFINPLFPNPPTLFVRNPPHVFGVGYVQQLAYEMTHELQDLHDAAQVAAQKNKGVTQSVKLTSKGVDFGTFQTTCLDSADKCIDDFTHVEGVSADLIVRPLQWKGIASSVRHFVRDALDNDKDGKIDEVTVGNLTAMVAFVAMTRPPVRKAPDQETAAEKLGEQIFSGNGSKNIPANNKMCATCHIPSLKLTDATLLIEDPAIPVDVKSIVAPKRVGTGPTLTDATTDPSTLAVTRIRAMKLKGIAPQAPDFYKIDLTNPTGLLPNSYTLPRLPAADDGGVEVPLFSDLRRHNMGDGLTDPLLQVDGKPVEQGTDVVGISVPAPLFLTRPLWGVADTGPWLHDGRARSLKEAILLHESNGSEANPVIEVFKSLMPPEQDAVISFLLTLQLPLQKGL